MTPSAWALYSMRADRDEVARTFDDLDDTIAAVAAHERHSVAAYVDYLQAVVEARFAVIRHGLHMTREVIQ